jgi:hypothetical protein
MKRLLCCLLLAAVADARPQIGNRGTVQGVVLRGDTGEPVADAVIAVDPLDEKTAAGKMPDPTTSDSRGRFTLPDLNSGNYRLIVARNGYLRHRETRLELDAGQSQNPVVVRLMPTGTVSGRILDELGQPIGDIPVRLFDFVSNGETTTRTNDRGEYRFFYLSPGQYWLAAGQTSPTPIVRANGAVTGFQEDFELTYYPGVRERDSSRPANVKAAEELSGMNIVMGKPRPPAPAGPTVAPPPPIPALPAGTQGLPGEPPRRFQ